MFRVKDTNLTDDQLLALVGRLVRMEYSSLESYVMEGEGVSEVGIVTKVDFHPTGRFPMMGKIHYENMHSGERSLWFNGDQYCSLYFTTPEEA